MAGLSLVKIVSGGQTGVDQGALDAAIELTIEHGGWCPAGRRCETGRIPAKYQLNETDQRDYFIRTERNVVDSDGTLILYRGSRSRGTELTYRMAKKHRRPELCIDLNEVFEQAESFTTAQQKLGEWLAENRIGVLNVAGPRESNATGIQNQSRDFLLRALSPQQVYPSAN